MTSVIVPVFNGAVIADVTTYQLLQEKHVDEWLWVDDGSTDQTASVLDRATRQEERARVIRLPENQGRSAARNAGIAASQGDILLFLDVDVELEPGAAVALIDAVSAEGAVAAVARLAPVLTDPSDPYQDYLAHFPRGPSRSTQPGDSLDWRFFLSGACAIRRDALLAVGGFDTGVEYGEDVDLACRLSQRAPDGLRLAGTTVKLHDIGSLDQALARADAFGRSLPALDERCRQQALGRLGGLPGARSVSRVASPVLEGLVRRMPAGPTRRRSVRYLLATRILSASRRA